MSPNETAPTTGAAPESATAKVEGPLSTVVAAPQQLRRRVDAALDLAAHGWQVFPLAGKVPIIPGRHGGRGVLDATTDPDVVAAWWQRWPDANIGARVPAPLVVIDVDPRHGGHLALAELEAEHGPIPETLTVWSGRGDGGRHLYLRRPPGRLTHSRLGDGIDLKTAAGYCVVPPSLHPDTSQPYRWELHPVATPPGWLVDLLRVPKPILRPVRTPKLTGGPSIADTFTAGTSWADILQPHGWRCLDADGDADGARWRHPTATSALSATVRHQCLFVFSTNTPFPASGAGDPRGLTRFRAYAVLNHHGDLSAAARALRAAA